MSDLLNLNTVGLLQPEEDIFILPRAVHMTLAGTGGEGLKRNRNVCTCLSFTKVTIAVLQTREGAVF